MQELPAFNEVRVFEAVEGKIKIYLLVSIFPALTQSPTSGERLFSLLFNFKDLASVSLAL